MQRYNPKEIEPKWQKTWDESKIYEASADTIKPKKYVLEYFPYPSGAAMHVGHVRNYTIGDVVSRHARMNGFNVLHPMGWDAFGLPAENYALKTGISPQQAIAQNTAKFKQQLMSMGFSYDWSREFASSDPEYYRWTQWFFLLLHKRGLAYRKESEQWWCPVDKTVLANEQVENGHCWRCGSEVEKKSLKQWFFKITDYADRLSKDLDDVDWSKSIKSMQRNWIGRSEGAEIDFAIDGDKSVTVYTTRADTLYGASFIVLAPEHPLLDTIVPPEHQQQVSNYQQKSQNKSDIERQETNREKTGVFTGAYAYNPINNVRLPIWTADYVLMGYGTGAIMAVPAHDERDHEFAQKHDLAIVPVIGDNDELINSQDYDGMSTTAARSKIVEALADRGSGQNKVNYRIRDWLISRQRYWGAPIPMIHCPTDGIVPVPEDQLPVVLPELTKFEPNGDGRSPLATVPEFVNTTCPTCGGPAERETDTMDGFACSSWYFLRFADPHNPKEPFDPAKAEFWTPVDDYIGGAEHAVMHLLYARMWTKVMQDAGLITFGEPFKSLRNQGMILAPDGQKMSKSKGNTIQPDELISSGYGADTIRIMELFIGPWNQRANWSIEGMGGSHRFLQRVWSLVQEYLEVASSVQPSPEASRALLVTIHKAIQKVTIDLETMSFNTAIAAMMECVNELFVIKRTLPPEQAVEQWRAALSDLTQLLAPFAPHISEELWSQLGHEGSVHTSTWPAFDEQYLVQDSVTMAVQVNSKLRGEITVVSGADNDVIIAAATGHEKVAGYLDGHAIIKTIVVPDKLVNFVIS